MKPVLILVLSYVCKIHADDSNSIKIELNDVGGQATAGIVPRALSGPSYYDEVETENLKLVLDLTRRMAPVGIHELPPFDPYKVSNLKNVKIDSVPGVKAKIDVSNAVVRGLRQYIFSNVLLQTDNISVADAKLLKFEQSFQSLTIDGDVVGNITLFGIKTETITAKLSGLLKNLVVQGSIGLEKDFCADQWKFGEPHYNLNSYDISVGMDKLQLNLNDIQTLSGRSRSPIRIPRYDYHPLAKELAAIIGSEVLKQINKVLSSITADQVDAFLFPYYL